MRRTTLAATVLCAATLAACSDDDPVAPEDGLTQAERTLLVQSLLDFGFNAAGGQPVASSNGPAAIDVSNSFEVTVPCPVAGSVEVAASLEGTVDDVTGDIDLQYEVDQTHRGCTVRSDDGSVELRIDGEPGTSLDYAFTVSDGLYQAEGTLSGGVRYTAGDRTGVCTTELSWSGSGGIEGGGAFTLSGTVCGIEITTSYSGP